ncbi:MAG: 7TM domain-containing protein [Candidatus Gracilibacteria bacterium]|nr:7TM domain-containing protein [Candidatus Gracilibacteria bacterium]
MRKYIFFLLFLIPVSVFAETATITQSGNTTSQHMESCKDLYQIQGASQIKTGTLHEYIISTSDGGDFSGNTTYVLKRDNVIIETTTGREKYIRYFTTPGEVIIEANIAGIPVSCTGSIQKKIRVYGSELMYIGDDLSLLKTGMSDILEKNNILLESAIDKSVLPQNEASQATWNSIDQSDIFVIGSKDILGFFSNIIKLQKIKPVNFAKKKIYIISDFSRSFLSKIIASSLSQIGATRVFLISENQFYSIITQLSTGGKEDVSIGQELSYEKGNTVYSLSGFIEFLAYSGFSYQLLAFLLSITFVVLTLNFLKQVIGFDVFGIYYPVLLAITIVSLGFSGALMFIAIGFVSILIVNIFSKKVHLLIHAKRSLLISLYIMLFLFVLGIDNFFELSLINYSIFDNSLIIFPLFTTIVIADKIFQENINIFGKSGVFDALQYGIITFIIYSLFEYKTLQYFLISYPDVIVLVMLLNILVGRYMGLQVFEYFRFAPLLKKLDEEE